MLGNDSASTGSGPKQEYGNETGSKELRIENER